MIDAGQVTQEDRVPTVATILNGASVSDVIDLKSYSVVGVIMPSAWTTAAVTIEVSHNNGEFVGLVYDDLGAQVNTVASPTVSSAYTLSLTGMVPYRFVKVRSGTTASPVNQGGNRDVVIISRKLA